MKVEQEVVSENVAWREIWKVQRGGLELRVLWLPFSFKTDWRSSRQDRLLVEISAPSGQLLVGPGHFGSLRALLDTLEAELPFSECLRGGDWR